MLDQGATQNHESDAEQHLEFEYNTAPLSNDQSDTLPLSTLITENPQKCKLTSPTHTTTTFCDRTADNQNKKTKSTQNFDGPRTRTTCNFKSTFEHTTGWHHSYLHTAHSPTRQIY